MIVQGEYRTNSDQYSLYIDNEKYKSEVLLVKGSTVLSAFKINNLAEFSYGNNKARDIYKIIKGGLKKCNSKNGAATPFELGVSSRHIFKRADADYSMERYKGELCGCEISSDKYYIFARYTDKSREEIFPSNIPYVKLTVQEEFTNKADNEDIPVRTLDEIALEKDLTWLKNKKYYVVNDEATAEQIFSYLDTYKGTVSFDTETTGLRINMFGEIGSDKKAELEEINANRRKNGEEEIRVDRLVGIIFCIEKDVSYYFPCFNRKFKNLYSDLESEVTQKTINTIKAKYTVGEYRNRTDYMANYVRNTPGNELGCDVILMERCRHILEVCSILAHHGTFEWKVCWMYHIDCNLKDDTLLLHQLMYKFRSTTSNKGEPSNLKYLSKVELGVDQLDLGDFFINYKEDDSGLVYGKKKKDVIIDFSYMDYKGSKAYAPADGDLTLQLYFKYKADLVQNHIELQYLYDVEVIVACAIGYMEFYGHRLDEGKVESIRQQYVYENVVLEHLFRVEVGYNGVAEDDAYTELIEKNEIVQELKKSESEAIQELKKIGSTQADKRENITKQLEKIQDELKQEIDERIKLENALKKAMDSSDKVINLGSPAQVADLFFNKLKIPCSEDKISVAKKVVKGLLKAKTEDGKLRYPIVKYYSDWKNNSTLLTKFFDNLPNFMYPGGFIFSTFGQISTATGRMSCSKPNAQQYPKTVSHIVCPREGYVTVDSDFSQIEYRTLVAMAPEPSLREQFKDPDMDYHTMMASLMYSVPYALVTSKMRSDAKSFNFGIPYGMGFKSLAILLTGMSGKAQIEEAKEKYELYFKDQPNVRKFFEKVKESARIYKKTETKWHRTRGYSFVDKDGNFSQSRRAMAERQAGNAVIQGCIHPEIRLQTKEYGIVKIKDVVNQTLQVWNGSKWTWGDILYSGKKRKCIVRFSTGQEFICSPEHKFLVRSAKGHERFVECQNLKGSINSKTPHRVVITREYEASDWRYLSDEARLKYTSGNLNAKNVFLDDIGDSFKIGVVLGRLASDGNILNDKDHHTIRQIIAEHEFDVYDVLKEYMKPLGTSECRVGVREGRNEDLIQLNVHSKTLVEEISGLDIKHKLHDDIFRDTEMLRGFLRGMFDGDGGISGKTITLVFGTQYDFEPMCRDIQKALLFFGIRSRYYKYDYRYKITIKTNDNQKFLDMIGFINEGKQGKGMQLECVRDEHVFGQVLIPESVEITDEYIDMYDVCNTEEGYYVADGIVTHNTAADIFKISVARNFSYIRRNGLLGLILIINMVHDEQLMEINVEKLNPQRALRDIIANMEMQIDGFPPLYVGAGVSDNWADAKGKIAEIHPVLAEQLSREADNESIWADKPNNPQDVINYFADRVYKFREQKIIDYVLDERNYGEVLHPVIGNLLGLQFDYGANKDFQEYCRENNLSKEETEKYMLGVPNEELRRFIEAHNLGVDYKLFKGITDMDTEEEEESEYDDNEDIDATDYEVDGGFNGGEFALIDEDTEMFGIAIQDIIREFGLVVSHTKKLCGIDVTVMSYKTKDELIDYLIKHKCEDKDEGSLQVVFLRENNLLYYTDVWVNNIAGSEISSKLGLNLALYR